MSLTERTIQHLRGQTDTSLLFLPNLTLWYAWHQKQGTLPPRWKDSSLVEISRELGMPVWLPVRPWRVETPGVERHEQNNPDTRILRYTTEAGVLTARWKLGPDGDWWQTEHLVKEPSDIPAALLLAESITYVLETNDLERLGKEIGDSGILALELARRPYSNLLHDFVGWSQGLLLLMGKDKDAFREINDLLEVKIQGLNRQLVELPGQVIYSPDNLDGQYISPKVFDEFLAESYLETAREAHKHNKIVIVHIGGPSKRLLKPLGESGIDVLEGIAGPPQSDATLIQARQFAGPGLVFWGGIPQDYLSNQWEREKFIAVLKQTAQDARDAGQCVLGVADRVPTWVELDRLRMIPKLIEIL